MVKVLYYLSKGRRSNFHSHMLLNSERIVGFPLKVMVPSFWHYTRDAPLYLEWAPDNILSQNPTASNVKDEKVAEGDVRRAILEQAVEGISDGDLDPDRVEVCFDGPFSCFPFFSFVLFIHCDG